MTESVDDYVDESLVVAVVSRLLKLDPDQVEAIKAGGGDAFTRAMWDVACKAAQGAFLVAALIAERDAEPEDEDRGIIQ